MNQVKNKIISKTTRDKLLKRIMNNYIYIYIVNNQRIISFLLSGCFQK